jgi:hypothetical protein
MAEMIPHVAALDAHLKAGAAVGSGLGMGGIEQPTIT